jgi:hypothetical protein
MNSNSSGLSIRPRNFSEPAPRETAMTSSAVFSAVGWAKAAGSVRERGDGFIRRSVWACGPGQGGVAGRSCSEQGDAVICAKRRH